MIKKVLDTITKFNMIQYGDEVIVGLSGGADSVCLLIILNTLREQLKFQLSAIHVHHGIRGQAADDDVVFVQSLCHKLEIPLRVEYRNIKEEARLLKLSEEEAGRKARYEIFEKRSKELMSGKIALGHHKNDQAETILFNVIRGAGLKGLGGIRPVRDRIIRPLIECTRLEIEMFCKDQGINYQDDETNCSLVYTRNRIRLEIIPYIEKYLNPKFIHQMGNMGELLREEDDYLDHLADKFLSQHLKQEDPHSMSLNADELIKQNLVIRRRIYRKVILKLGVALKDYEQKHIQIIEDLLNKKTGKRIDLPYGVFVEKVYNELCFMAGKEKEIPWNYMVSKDNNKIYIKEAVGSFEFTVFVSKNIGDFPQNNYTKWFDYDKIKGNYLTIRNRRNGDFIYLNGLKGRKKLKDFFIDLKVPRSERDHVPILLDENEIIWIVGYRMSESYKVTKDTTRILQVHYIKEDS